MKKRIYRATHVKELNVERLCGELADGCVVVGVDVAKEDMVAGLMDGRVQVVATVKWRHPEQSQLFMEVLEAVQRSGRQVEVAMEPSGTYGDALRVAVLERGIPVYRVSPKRCHDAAEVYDGVPSQHDAKSAAIIAKLHLDRASEPWPVKSEGERTLAAALRVLQVYEGQFQENRNRLEAILARHWPELGAILDLGSATLLELLKTYGGAGAVVADEAGARELMQRVGRGFLKTEKVEEVVRSARTSFGMGQLEEERRLVMEIAGEARRNQQKSQKAKKRVEQLTPESESAARMTAVVGKVTAAVLMAALGDPGGYDNATAYLKSAGLNLKEKSSGKQKGGLHITKRGPGVARQFLYLAVLRLLQTDRVIRAWYAKKVARQGGKLKSKAVVAIMRKLVLALWYVARGSRFDSAKLFDVSRLNLDLAAEVALAPIDPEEEVAA